MELYAVRRELVVRGGRLPRPSANSSFKAAHNVQTRWTHTDQSVLTSKIILCSPKQKVEPNGLVLLAEDDLSKTKKMYSADSCSKVSGKVCLWWERCICKPTTILSSIVIHITGSVHIRELVSALYLWRTTGFSTGWPSSSWIWSHWERKKDTKG